MMLRQLGTSSVWVPPIGQGTMGMGGRFKRESSWDSEHLDAIRMGIDMGMTFIDTAEVYASGHAEELVAKAINGIRSRVVVASKVSPENLRYDDVMLSCEKSLRRLATDYIDLYQIHWPNPAVPIAETMQAMLTLRDQGKIRQIGVSNFSVRQLRESLSASGEAPIAAIQVEYNLFDRTVENVLLPFCRKNDISLIAYSPLDQGMAASCDHGAEVIEGVSETYDKTPSQIALNWLVRDPHVVAIPKALSPDHIRLNATAADFELADDDAQKIASACVNVPVDVSPARIRVALDGADNRKVYQSLEDALDNPLAFTPSPSELALDLRKEVDPIKPVRVRASTDESGQFDYDLVEGRIRYWAWVIAYGGEQPIPVLVRT